MDKLIGVLITLISHVSEVEPFSNAVAFQPADGVELIQYLDEIDNRMIPVVMVDHFFTVDEKYESGYSHELDMALANSQHFGRIVFMFDEPMWRASRNGQSHSDVINVMRDVKHNYPGAEIMHIEAYAELYRQFIENEGKLTLFYDADHIGFNCYGEINSCGGNGVPGLSQLTYLNEINKAIIAQGSAAKLFLVPGAFTSENYFTDEQQVIDQLEAYFLFFENNSDYFSGLGAFIWGNLITNGTTITGARENELIRNELEVNLPKLGKSLDEFLLILDNGLFHNTREY